jgi:anhydro-N-acetylmuramic acid kinase
MKRSIIDQRSDATSLPTLHVVGLMSGTSLDGCDAVLARISPRERSVRIETLHFITYPMPEGLRARIVKQLKPETSRIDELTQLDAALGNWFVEAVEQLLKESDLTKNDVDLIGSHGQTMWHDVQPRSEENAHLERMTWQLGDGSFIAAKTGITTVCDFRTADVALGGQGAPLMPVFDHLVYGNTRSKTIALQNIGGIGNVTILPRTTTDATQSKIMGFDTGPGNMIIDRFAEKISQGLLLYDRDGCFAAQGKIDEALLQHWLQHSFFQQLPPKSTGREQFGHEYADHCWQDALDRGVSPMDAIATATALTAKTIAIAYEQAKATYVAAASSLSSSHATTVYPDHVVVAGGGAHNLTLMRMLARYLRPKTRLTRAGDSTNYNPTAEFADPSDKNDDNDAVDNIIQADSKEAVAFAVFAYQAVCGRSNHLPSTTGAAHEIILGKICPGLNFRQLLLQPASRHYLPPNSHTRQCNGRQERPLAAELPVTETRLFASLSLDTFPAEDIVRLLNDEDTHVSQVVSSLQPKIAQLAALVAGRIGLKGRVFYVGAGTSGRLGVLDASEIPPTFSAPGEWFQGLIAGGDRALRHAVEGAEDNREQGAHDLLALDIHEHDVVIGIASSGTTPYVHGALHAAKEAQSGCHTVLLSCNPLHTVFAYVDTYLTAVVGPEVLTGSTRMKAGTATKLILNQLSTVAMILVGKTYGNLMVDVKVSNQKLRRRALRILQLLCRPLSEEDAADLLERSGNKVKTALAMQLTCVGSKEEAEAVLERCGGRLGNLISHDAAS